MACLWADAAMFALQSGLTQLPGHEEEKNHSTLTGVENKSQ